jgi:hypothetical protein
MPSTAKPEVSAALFKELLVEWTLRNWESGLVNDLSATNLTKMSIFDAENFDSTNVNTPAYPALDLYSALTRAVSDIDRESYLIQRLAPLMQPENTELRQEVERLLDVELIGYSKVKQEKLNLRSKVACSHFLYLLHKLRENTGTANLMLCPAGHPDRRSSPEEGHRISRNPYRLQ